MKRAVMFGGCDIAGDVESRLRDNEWEWLEAHPKCSVTSVTRSMETQSNRAVSVC